MKVKYKDMMTISLNVYYVFETEDNRIGMVSIPIATRLIDAPLSKFDLQSKLSATIGVQVVELEHVGLWDNCADSMGMIDHPFENRKVHINELSFDFIP